MELIAADIPATAVAGGGTVVAAALGAEVFTAAAFGAATWAGFLAGGGAGNFAEVLEPGGRPRFLGGAAGVEGD
ncbi:MAG: hypothetical protein DVB31_05395 [Verrucomicrobia bacterium]|nr:MAG: hypothetical protein DVB31_05395 [Verrucomicrobiota bacterium]